MMNVILIVAHSLDNVIGVDNKLPFKQSKDLQMFKQLTSGHPMIMGRKTFQSLPTILPNRHHIVISNSGQSSHFGDSRVTWVKNIHEAITTASMFGNNVFVIGGGEIYQAFMKYANTVYVTEVQTYLKDNTDGKLIYFPELSSELDLTYEKKHDDIDDYNQYPWVFKLYKRRN